MEAAPVGSDGVIDHDLDERLMQSRGFFSVALGLVILLLATGCNYHQRLTVDRLPPLPEHDKIPLRTVLLLTDKQCDFTYEVNQSRSLRQVAGVQTETIDAAL